MIIDVDNAIAFQSTHPLRGATRVVDCAGLLNRYFNPRTPCGVRPGCGSSGTRSRRFQSTHPLRGATGVCRNVVDIFQISIHAPPAGCDPRSRAPGIPRTNFNPRTPCGVRLLALVLLMCSSGFQSTHPLRGATIYKSYGVLAHEFQSTHPMRGATRQSSGSVQPQPNFNPRTPCGVRLGRFDWTNHTRVFQSTHPLRGATPVFSPATHPRGISIHAPPAGCDGDTTSSCLSLISFQSTHPLRGATNIPVVLGYSLNISIHAPPAGCDVVAHLIILHLIYISIHAPPAGCDRLALSVNQYNARFQSTHPLRGATPDIVGGTAAF